MVAHYTLEWLGKASVIAPFYRWGNGGSEKLTYDPTTNDCGGARRHWEGGTQGLGRVSGFLCPSGQGDLNQLVQLTGGKYHPCRRPWLTEAGPADTGQAGMSRADRPREEHGPEVRQATGVSVTLRGQRCYRDVGTATGRRSTAGASEEAVGPGREDDGRTTAEGAVAKL